MFVALIVFFFTVVAVVAVVAVPRARLVFGEVEVVLLAVGEPLRDVDAGVFECVQPGVDGRHDRIAVLGRQRLAGLLGWLWSGLQVLAVGVLAGEGGPRSLAHPVEERLLTWVAGPVDVERPVQLFPEALGLGLGVPAFHRLVDEAILVAQIVAEALLRLGLRLENLGVRDSRDVDGRHLADDAVGQLPDHRIVRELVGDVDVVDGVILADQVGAVPLDGLRADGVAAENAVLYEPPDAVVVELPRLDPRVFGRGGAADLFSLVEDLVAFEVHPLRRPRCVHDATVGAAGVD